jgi:acetyltransferase (GNAT) family protein
MRPQAVPDLEFVRYEKETFPGPKSEFDCLFDAHGREVRGEPFDLDFRRYRQIELEGRLVWIVARDNASGSPVGYACSWWYRDMHFDERVAADDLWFVHKYFRHGGIGKVLKTRCHQELERNGVMRVYDSIRLGGVLNGQMVRLGFRPWGMRWLRLLGDST